MKSTLFLLSAGAVCTGVPFSRRGITVAAATAATIPNAAHFTAASAATDTATTQLEAAQVYAVLTDSSPKLSSPYVKRVDTIIDTCIRGKRAVFLGEHHDSLVDHLLQAELIRTVRPSCCAMAVGLEAVQQQYQPALDAYVAGNLREDELEAAVQWRTRWSWSFDAFVPVLRICRELTVERGLPTQLLALNVDSEDWRQVVTGGFPNLAPAAFARYVPDPRGFESFAATAAYTEYVSRVLRPSYAQTPMRIRRRRTSTDGQQGVETIDIPFANYFLGRQLWDEGMATAAASWCAAHPQGLMIGLLGSEHVAYGCGVPARCARQLGGVRSVATLLLNPDPYVGADLAEPNVAGVMRTPPARGSNGRVDLGDLYTLQLPFAVADMADDVWARDATQQQARLQGGVSPSAAYSRRSDPGREDRAAEDRAAAFTAAQTCSPSSGVLALADFLLFS